MLDVLKWELITDALHKGLEEIVPSGIALDSDAPHGKRRWMVHPSSERL